MQDLLHTPPKYKIVVIIPAYNEGAVLISVIKEILLTGFVIIVVDDGSDIPLNKMLQSYPLFYIRHRANLGQGAALQTGFDFAKKLNPDIIITMDADGQHHSSSFNSMIEPLLTNDADIVLGSRFLSPGQTSVPIMKKVVLHTARLINYIFSGLLLSDAHNGLRAFNATALQKITITENRMAHASEILFEIKKHKLRFKEVPVTISYTAYSKKKGQSIWDSVRILFDLILHKLFK